MDVSFSMVLRSNVAQENLTLLAVAFASDADPYDAPPVYGSVTPLGGGTYSVSYTPTYADT